MNDKCVEDKCMNDKWLDFAIRIQSIADFNTEKIHMIKNAMKN